ncbi:Citrate-sodium symporter [Salmonella enterica subsp. enterica]|nr:Citrate-sodium symporter [Salmonella enterica subsp. enterica]
MFVMGAIFGEIGKRLPIFNKYIGGAPVYDISGCSLFCLCWHIYAERN